MRIAVSVQQHLHSDFLSIQNPYSVSHLILCIHSCSIKGQLTGVFIGKSLSRRTTCRLLCRSTLLYSHSSFFNASSWSLRVTNSSNLASNGFQRVVLKGGDGDKDRTAQHPHWVLNLKEICPGMCLIKAFELSLTG
jgi:hypothetical protein